MPSNTSVAKRTSAEAIVSAFVLKPKVSFPLAHKVGASQRQEVHGTIENPTTTGQSLWMTCTNLKAAAQKWTLGVRGPLTAAVVSMGIKKAIYGATAIWNHISYLDFLTNVSGAHSP